MDSVLRPRDIQARIRSGEDPESVAAAAQTSVDKIMGYATPVLAERAYVAQQAQKASVRRRSGDGAIGHLGEAVEQRLSTKGVDVEDVSWDAWRREDGRWTLVADYPGGGGSAGVVRASFVYDQAGRYVTADDDEARWLVGERATSSTPTPAASSEPAPSEVPDTEPAAGQLPLGDDAIELVTGLRPAPEPPAADDWITTQASERTRPAPVARVAEETPETLFDTPEPAAQPEQPAEEPSPEVAGVVEPEQAGDSPAADTPAKPRKSSKSKRASVPSWDEIMFGSGKGE